MSASIRSITTAAASDATSASEGGGRSTAIAPAAWTASMYAAGRSAAGCSHAPHRAASTYVVSPTTGRRSEPLEATLALPVGNRAPALLDLDAGRVQVVVDDAGLERGERHLAVTQQA